MDSEKLNKTKEMPKLICDEWIECENTIFLLKNCNDAHDDKINSIDAFVAAWMNYDHNVFIHHHAWTWTLVGCFKTADC